MGRRIKMGNLLYLIIGVLLMGNLIWAGIFRFRKGRQLVIARNCAVNSFFYMNGNMQYKRGEGEYQSTNPSLILYVKKSITVDKVHSASIYGETEFIKVSGYDDWFAKNDFNFINFK